MSGHRNARFLTARPGMVIISQLFALNLGGKLLIPIYSSCLTKSPSKDLRLYKQYPEYHNPRQ